jgi:tetratricopeptide (TPR) repeat protein/transcriptional regulator with XRE-family HTH domain
MAVPVPSFGELLRRYRLAAGLTHAALAERAGLSVRAISDLERGVNRKPHKDTFEMLAAALGLTAEERAAFEAVLRGHLAVPAPLAPDRRWHPARGAMPFVGRRAELASLEHHIAGGTSPLLLIAGEPGIGKSRLLHEAARQAATQGWTVLSGGCHRRSGEEPYAPLLGALERHVTSQAPAVRRVTLRGCAWLVRLLPELTAEGGPLPAWTVPPTQERRLIFKAVATYLANISGARGTLLVLDDLQWAGQDALDLLAALARMPAGTLPLSLIGAYRDTEITVSSPLATLLADLAREGLARRAELGPLPDKAAAELIASLLPGAEDDAAALREEVVRRGEGVPFFLVSCALALQAEGSSASAAHVPWDVAETVRQRVAALAAPAPALLSAAAVVGRRVPRVTLMPLAAGLGWDQATAIAALEAALRGRLLVEDDQAYQFAHDLIREVVAGDLSAGRRSALHLQVANVLEHGAGEPPVEALAYHYARAGDSEKAVVYLERSGARALGMHANAEAEGHYSDLVARLDTLGHPVEAAQAREKLAFILRVTGHYDGALELEEEALEAYRAAGDIEGMANAGGVIGWLHMLRGTMSDGLPVVTSLIRELTRRGLSAAGLANLYIGLAQLYFSADRYSELGEAAQRAFELAQEAGDERLQTLAQSKQAIALCQLGQIDEGKRALEECCRRMEAIGDDWGRCTALNNLACVYDDDGAFDKAMDCVELALALAERIGDAEQIAFMTYRCGQEAFFLGDWARTRRDYERAVALIHELGDVRGSSYPPSKLARLAFAEGRLDEAMRCSDEASESASRKQDAQSMRYIHATIAEYEVLQGRPQAALDRLTPLLESPTQEWIAIVEILPLVAWALLERGDIDRADEVIEQAVQRASVAHLRSILLDARRIEAQVRMARRRWGEAQAAVEEALVMAHTMAYPYAEAKVLYVYGLLHAAHVEPDQARERLEAALAICARLGERLYAAHVERAIAELPVRAERAPSPARARSRPAK